MAVLAVVVLTAFAAQAPSPLRKLVLFPVAFGVMAGLVIAWIRAKTGWSSLHAAAGTAVLTLGGLTAIAWQGHRQLVAEHRAAVKNDPQRALSQSLLEYVAADDPSWTTSPLDRDPTLLDYLAARTSSLGQWRAPWPVVFWCAESLLAAIAGAIVACRWTFPRTHSSADSP
jgi:hypothetical protein